MDAISRKKAVRSLTLLCSVVYFCSYLTRLDYGAVISEIITSEGISKTDASMAQTGLFIFYGCGQLVSGYLSEKVKPQIIMISGLVLSCLMNIAVTFSPNPYFTAGFWCVNGLAQAMMWPPIVKILSKHLKLDEYKNATVIASTFTSFATITIYLIAPVCISLGNWRYLFYLNTFIAMCAVLLLVLRINPALERFNGCEKADKGSALEAPTPKKLSRYALYILILLVVLVALHGMIRDGVETWMPSFIAESFNLTNSVAILSGVAIPLFSIGCRFVARWINTKVTNEIVCVFIFFVLAVASLVGVLFMRKSGPVFSVVLMALVSGCMHSVNLMLTCFVPMWFRKFGKSALVSGIINSGTYVGSAISMFGIALLSENYGWNVSVIAWIVIGSGAILLSLFLIKRKPF